MVAREIQVSKKALEEYSHSLAYTHTCPCMSCHRLMMQNELRTFAQWDECCLQGYVDELFRKKIYSVPKHYRKHFKMKRHNPVFCSTCLNHMIRYYELRGVDVHIEWLGFRPPMSYIEFPTPIPSVERLSKLESRLIAPRFAFGKIMECMYKQHTKLNGAIVNVPADLNKIQKMLPRLPLDGQTISL